jgi:F0F1-type ATP synthase delta subunit
MGGYTNNLDQKHLIQDIKNQKEEIHKNLLRLLTKQKILNYLQSFFLKYILLERRE